MDILSFEELKSLEIFQTIKRVAKEKKTNVYLVGGCIRDILLQRGTKDIDMLVVGSGVEFAKAVSKEIKEKNYLSVFKNFGTANLKTEEIEIEFVGARKESYDRKSRNPVVESGTLEEDLERRDFTINALATEICSLSVETIIDRFGGLTDLNNGIIRTPLDPDITFSDDPLRMMRAIRFASQINFKLDSNTYEAIKRNKDRLTIISQERITEEFNKILLSKKPSIGLNLLWETGLLAIFFPELVKLQGVQTVNNQSHKDNFFHTLQVVDNIAFYTNDLWLRWSALLHDIGKPATQRFDEKDGEGWTFHGHEVVGFRMVPKIFSRLKLPQHEVMKYVQKMVLLHLRPIALAHEVSDSAIRRLIVDAGDDIEDLLNLCRADITSKNKDKVSRYLQKFEEVWKRIKVVEEKDRLRNWKPPITGEIIMSVFGIPPSRTVGVLKDIVKDAILDGIIPNEYDAAFEFMLVEGKKLKLIITNSENPL